MNKQELVSLLVEEHEISKVKAGNIVDSIFTNIMKAVSNGDTFQLVGFGTFKSVARAEREARNPTTGETVHVSATVVPKFVPGAIFKKTVAR